MNLVLLDTFRMVVREGSALRAAERLGCTQSNVTARIRQLENELGAEIFERHGKRLILNPNGSRFIPFCDEILDLMSRAREALIENADRIPLRLGSMESTAASRLPSILARHKRIDPDAAVSVRIAAASELLTLLAQGELDAALTACTSQQKGFRYVPIFDEELAVACACDVSITDLPNVTTLSLLAFAEGCPYRQIAEDWLRRRQIHITRTLTCNSYDAIVSCAAAGMGVAIIPRRLIANRIEKGEISGHAFADLPPTTTYYVTAATSLQSEALGTLVRCLKESSDQAYASQL